MSNYVPDFLAELMEGLIGGQGGGQGGRAPMSEEERRRQMMAGGLHPGSAGSMAQMATNPGLGERGQLALGGAGELYERLNPGQENPYAQAPAPVPRINPQALQALAQLFGNRQEQQQPPPQQEQVQTPQQASSSMALDTGRRVQVPKAGEDPATKVTNAPQQVSSNSESMGAASTAATAAASIWGGPMGAAAVSGGLTLASGLFGGDDESAKVAKKMAQTEERQAAFGNVFKAAELMQRRNMAMRQTFLEARL